MPTITVKIEVPEGASVRTEEGPGETLSPQADPATPQAVSDGVERYWCYLSENGRELYSAAAAIEQEAGPGFTLDDLAERMGRNYERARSFHRTTGRSARKWRDDTGADAPIELKKMRYEWDESEGGMRWRYRLPDDVASKIAAL